MIDVLKSNLGICTSVVARIDLWQGWPDGRGTNTYAIPREHASELGQYWIPIKEVYGPKGKVLISELIAKLTAADIAALITYDELVAEGGIPTKI